MEKNDTTLLWIAVLGIAGYLVYEHKQQTGRYPWQSAAVNPGTASTAAPSPVSAAPATSVPLTITQTTMNGQRRRLGNTC
jgi:hypothetical protein